jgi:hypothetical protein
MLLEEDDIFFNIARVILKKKLKICRVVKQNMPTLQGIKVHLPFFFYIIMLKFSLLKEKKEKSNDIRFFLNYLFII